MTVTPKPDIRKFLDGIYVSEKTTVRLFPLSSLCLLHAPSPLALFADPTRRASIGRPEGGVRPLVPHYCSGRMWKVQRW